MKGAKLAVVVMADKTKSDVWIEDCSIASILLQLTAQSLGLGSCWIQIRNRTRADGCKSGDYVKKIIQASDENLKVESIIAIGYPVQARTPKPKEELQYEKVDIL
jgi:nitroreductase